MKKIIEIGFNEYGTREVPGDRDNPEIIKYFNELGFNGSRLKDETAWCSAYANWVAKKSNCAFSGELTARSWLNVGKTIKTPQLGDIVVLWRESPDSWKGHVGFFIKQNKSFVYLLGGNQTNKVCIQGYPVSRILDYRKI